MAERHEDRAEGEAGRRADDDGVQGKRLGARKVAGSERPADREETPPPIAPADSICISMISGKTSAMAASGVVPRMPT